MSARDCRVCGGPGVTWGQKRGYELSRCRRCGSVFVSGDISAATTLYEHYYDDARFEIPPIVRSALEGIVRSAAKYKVTGRWLDVGYGEGGLLEVATASGWKCYGTEISPPVLEYGVRCGWTVAESLRDSVFPPDGFDVVTMVEVLEHVSQPMDLLMDASRLLRPGGLLFATTPNARSLNRYVLGAAWSVFSPPEHLTLWTRKALTAALSECGITPVRLRTEGLNPAEIVARYCRRTEGATPIDRNKAAVTLNTSLSRTSSGRRFKNTANALLSLAGVGDTLKTWAVRRDV